MGKFSVSIYVYKIKICFCVVLPRTVFLVAGFSVSFSNNQQFLEAFPSRVGAGPTGFPSNREVATPADCDKEPLPFFS